MLKDLFTPSSSNNTNRMMVFNITKHTVVDTVIFVEEKCVSETTKDGTEIYEVSYLSPYSSNSFVNFKLSRTRFIIRPISYKRRVYIWLHLVHIGT